ncbi:MAG: flavodoxin domain-containing protein [Clostridium argentinense]|uniref:Flavodoxin domain-containing protein n=1 Tax=Clostridium faecium TaxID=2762223 RepID=A0ABR8YQJ0_9CLOT|nr:MULTISPECIES: flavodoxin domain-containing protein [Clostridium]MBD8046510.1 flavodoxin domain-containing protein [Clostridium faecium]MBS5823017.1 flavodoxin domain-containing protein [Clostridium argentinense]
MKTLVVYESKHGCTEKCAMILNNKLQGEVIVINIRNQEIPNIEFFNNVIIGGSIYMGKIQNKIRKFCFENVNILKNKKIGLFICCMNKENEEMQLKSSFPKELLLHASAIGYFGGEFILENMNVIEKFIVKKLGKTDKDISNISKENIDKFAKLINNI